MASITETIDSTGVWTCPVGVTEADITCFGGGGGGRSSGGGGGGGGACSYTPAYAVSSGHGNYDVTVGAGGAVSGNGGTTWFDTISSVKALGGFASASSVGGTGGLSATGVGTTKTAGGNGGAASGVNAGGGGAAGSPDGDGQAGSVWVQGNGVSGAGDGGVGGVGIGSAGAAGQVPGGGGGGGSVPSAAANVGGHGRVLISYDNPYDVDIGEPDDTGRAWLIACQPF